MSFLFLSLFSSWNVFNSFQLFRDSDLVEYVNVVFLVNDVWEITSIHVGTFLSITANITNLSNACEQARSHIFPYSLTWNDPRPTPYCTWILQSRVKFECNAHSGIILSPFSYMALYHKKLIRSLRTDRCDVLISKVVLWIITTKAIARSTFEIYGILWIGHK